MDIQVDAMGDVTVLAPNVEFLDASNARAFKDGAVAAVGHAKKVVLDLGNVQFVDSTGCGAILTCLKQVTSAGGDLRICGVTQPVRALFDLVRMHRIMEIHRTRDEAAKSFAEG